MLEELRLAVEGGVQEWKLFEQSINFLLCRGDEGGSKV
jgi:hypothetical protein